MTSSGCGIGRWLPPRTPSCVTARVREADLEIVLAAEREAGQLTDEFLATMSHELRTPLTAITGYTELLGMDTGLASTQAADIAQIAESAGNLLGLVDDVLRLAELEPGRVTLVRERADVLHVVAPAPALAATAVEVAVKGRQSRRHGAAGLGLAISDRLVRLHGGTISVESEPGTRRTFTVRLPRP